MSDIAHASSRSGSWSGGSWSGGSWSGGSWSAIVRLALVQTAIGALVVLVTSTLNRIMIVELALPALLPAALVALHYLVQLFRVHQGYRVDRGARCTPRIIGGMALLSASAMLAAGAVTWMPTRPRAALLVAIIAYVGVGLGVGAAGTANLTLLTRSVAPKRRAVAAGVTWMTMIAGFGVSAGTAGHFLQPFSALRLLQVFAVASAAAFAVAWLAVRGAEQPGALSGGSAGALSTGASRPSLEASFALAFRQLWADTRARRFTLFLFISMFAYSAQELLLEPFAGLVFGFPPAASARLVGLQNGGVLLGMIGVMLASIVCAPEQRARFSQRWMRVGTVGSAIALTWLAVIAASAHPWMLPAAAAALGVANGTFAVAALGAMMELSADGGRGSEGLRMGLWGAAQAVAFAAGGIGSGALVDMARRLLGTPAPAYSLVLLVDALLFLVACCWTVRLDGRAALQPRPA